MSELISGKEALIALVNGEEVEYLYGENNWLSVIEMQVLITAFTGSKFKFRLKPRTITLNGIEVPAPFEPKATDDCKCYHINTAFSSGFDWYHSSHHQDYRLVWQTEAEIKQVVAALRSVFKGGEK